MKKVIITTSWDDGNPSDLKLAGLLRRYSIPATFYIPIKNREGNRLSSNQIREVAKNFDIGGHTINHVNLTQISIKKAEKEIFECKRKLEEMGEKQITLFCYPYGAYNEDIVKIVKRANFKGARTDKCSQTKIYDAFKMGTTVHARNCTKFHYVKEALYAGDFKLAYQILKTKVNKSWTKIALETLNYVLKKGGIWHLRGHSREIEQNNDWRNLEEIFQKVSKIGKAANYVVLLDNSQLASLFSQHRAR